MFPLFYTIFSVIAACSLVHPCRRNTGTDTGAGTDADTDTDTGTDTIRYSSLSLSLYHVLAIRLGRFSKEPMKIFMVSNRAESKEHNNVKVMTIPLVESMEMVVEIERILN